VEYPPPDIQFVNVASAVNGSDYDLIATIRNNGSVDAHLTGGCSWKCPVFPETAGGATFAAGELLQKGGERAFTMRMTNLCALPLEVNCGVEVRSWVEGEKGSETKSVKWSGQVQMAQN
jgi:hypothetical protein